MPRGKSDLKKILASLTTTCSKCGRVIQPSEIRRVNFELMICPECGVHFDAAKTKRGKQGE
jgi:predicted RNA-binding Zn-ribbon protein involved in translation (DUF1610 family)